jgi:hypothetical protein
MIRSRGSKAKGGVPEVSNELGKTERVAQRMGLFSISVSHAEEEPKEKRIPVHDKR